MEGALANGVPMKRQSNNFLGVNNGSETEILSVHNLVFDDASVTFNNSPNLMSKPDQKTEKTYGLPVPKPSFNVLSPTSSSKSTDSISSFGKDSIYVDNNNVKRKYLLCHNS